MWIAIVEEIDIDKAYKFLAAPDAGAVNVFVGTVRNHAHGKAVLKLVFEAYAPMAIAEMRKIALRAQAKWPIKNLAMLHVVGNREVGDAVVLVGVSCAHRQASFEACQFLIDELKASVPIWKKEFYTDHSIWVNAHP